MVAVKQLDKHGLHGNKEFQTEVLSLGQLDHPNLVKLVGYCADGDQRLLVYDYVTGGSLQNHLHGICIDYFLRHVFNFLRGKYEYLDVWFCRAKIRP